jgi:glutathionyl-hydroquinone reductase
VRRTLITEVHVTAGQPKFWDGVPGGVDSDDTGRFIRRDSIFGRWVGSDPGAEFPPQTGRYHL